MTFRRIARVLASAGALALFSAPAVAQAHVVDYWIAAVPTNWNILQNGVNSNADGMFIPGPLIHARVGDKLRIHFKNMDSLRRDPHSMHFHGVHYKPSSDGAYVPGFSGRDADVKPGRSYTYKLTAGADSVGVWPYHDHSPSMMDSIAGGMFGMLSILSRHDRAPDREFEVVFTPFGKFMAID